MTLIGQYLNRVYKSSANKFVYWKTDAPDPTGVLFPPSEGAFGSTADYSVDMILQRPGEDHWNRARDATSSGWVHWLTTGSDSSGTSYPGPGTFAASTDRCTAKMLEQWTPLRLNPRAWYSAKHGVVETSGRVSTLKDQSVWAWNLTQGTAGNRPVLEDVSTPAGTRKAILFTRANDEFLRGYETRQSTSLTGTPDNGSVTKFFGATCMPLTSAGTEQTVFDIGNDAGSAAIAIMASDVLMVYQQPGKSLDISNRVDEIHSMTGEFKTSSGPYAKSWIDNYEMFTTQAPVSTLVTSLDAPSMGATWNTGSSAPVRAFDGYVFDAVEVWHGLTSQERSRYHAYLQAEYGIVNGTSWSPKDLAPETWCRADTGITLTSSRVSKWDDLSGNNFYFEQTTAGNRPVQSNAYGFDTIHFDAANTECLLSHSSQAWTNAEGYFWAIFGADSQGSPDPQVIFARLENFGMNIYTDPSGHLGFRVSGQDLEHSTSIDLTLIAASASYSAGSNFFYGFKNNVQVVSGTNSLGSTTNRLSVGATLSSGSPANGSTVELIEIGFVSRLLVGSEDTKIHSYFQKHWNTP